MQSEELYRECILPSLLDFLTSEDLMQNLPHVLHVYKPDARLDTLWNVLLNIGSVRCGGQDRLYSGAMSSQDLLFEATNW